VGAGLLLGWDGAGAEEQGKPTFGIALYHYNVQFVAGDQVIADRIIGESIYPLLQMYSRHPEWQFTFEIQAYGLELMAERDPECLELLRKLVERGQMELVVTHYSDQLFIAYPADDYDVSLGLARETLEKLSLKPSRVFFAQEAQFAPALPGFLQGEFEVMVSGGDPLVYYTGDTSHFLGELEFAERKLLVLNPAATNDAQLLDLCTLVPTQVGDGEAANTETQGNNFRLVEAKQKALEEKLAVLQGQGAKHLSVGGLVQFLLERGYQPYSFPYIPEGTWNMQEGQGAYNWMGRIAGGHTPDGLIRAAPYEARGHLLVAEALLASARAVAKERRLNLRAERLSVADAWKHLMLAEVSDSSGWNPRPVEEQYTLEQSAAAVRAADRASTALLERLGLVGTDLVVFTQEASARPLAEFGGGWEPLPPVRGRDALPVRIEVEGEHEIYCEKMDPQRYEIRIEAQPKEGAVVISFPLDGTPMYSPSLAEEEMVEAPVGLRREVVLPLSNGWLYLGNNVSVVKHCHVRHLAVRLEAGGRARFREEFARPERVTYRFTVLLGSPAEGHQFAQRLNTYPTYIVRATPRGRDYDLSLTRVTPEAPPPIPE